MFRILAYNLFFGGGDRLDAIHTVLAHANADVSALTEADDPDVVAALAGRLGMRHVWARGSGNRHIAALTRLPVAHWCVYNTPPLTQAVLEIRLNLPAGPFTVYNVHLLPTLLLPFELRRRQAVGRLLQVIKTGAPGPHLIVGDLNAIAPGDRVLQRRNPRPMRRLMVWQFGLIFKLALPRLLNAGYVDCFRALHPTANGFTWMPGNLTTRYDYILADPHAAARLQSCRVLTEPAAVQTASDHLPLLAEFDF
jgi:endonuclease/exonuclease/phosphatase family metal-dependent hydrolase